MYFLDCPKEARLSRMAKERKSNFFIIIFLWQEIQSKYSRNKPSPPRRVGTLGEIVSNTYSKLFHEAKRSLFLLYFNRISIVFPSYFLVPRLFLFSYHIQHSLSHFSGFQDLNYPEIRSHRHFFAFIGSIPTNIWIFGEENTGSTSLVHRDPHPFVEA